MGDLLEFNHPFPSSMFHPHHHPVPIAPHPFLPQQHHQPQQVRKRPKYSRSKLGCLSCRVRKVKCDETRPICNRCAHSQRECTWPADPPKSKKSQSQASAEGSPGSRPSTASSNNGSSDSSHLRQSSVSDVEWQSDTGGAGAIRRTNSVHDRLAGHARIPSLNRGRELTVNHSPSVSRNPSVGSNRDQSPNPFAYGLAQLAAAPGLTHHHHRSASTSSSASASSVSSLPYPLIAQNPPPIATNIPSLSSSRNSSPASGMPYTQSPNMGWTNMSSSERRPSTAGGLASSMDGLDLNNYAPGFDPNTFGNSAYLASGGFDGSMDTNFAFGGVTGFDGTGFSQDFSSAPGFDANNAFLVQLQNDMNGNTESPFAFNAPSTIDLDLSSAFPSNPSSSSNTTQLQSNPTTALQSSGFGGPIPMASGFGNNQTPTMPYGVQQNTGFGTTADQQLGSHQDHLQHQHLQPPSISVQAEFGGMTSISTGHYQPQLPLQPRSSPGTLPSPSNNPSFQTQTLSPSSQPQATTNSDMASGSTLARTLPLHHPSTNSSTLMEGVVAETTQTLDSSLPPQSTTPRPAGVEAGRYVVGTEAGHYTTAVRVGAEEPSQQSLISPTSSIPPPMLSMLKRSNGSDQVQVSRPLTTPSTSDQYPSTDSETAALWDAVAREPSLFKALGSPGSALQSQTKALQNLGSQKLQPGQWMSHRRQRSDTVTPANAFLSVSSQYGPSLEEINADGSPAIISPIRPLISNPDPIEPFFKTVQERNLVRCAS